VSNIQYPDSRLPHVRAGAKLQIDCLPSERSASSMSESTNSVVPDAVRDEVWRRIGRNLLLFQHIEEMMKAVLSLTSVEGPASSIQQKGAQRAEDVHRKTLGQLKEQYFEEVMSEGLPAAEPPQPLTEASFRFSYKIEPEGDRLDRDRAMFDALVSERNDLAHHFLARWRTSYANDHQAACDYLNQQRERALPVRDHLKSILEALLEHRQQVAEYLQSDEGKREMQLAWLQQSRLVTLLVEFSQTRCRPDGWTLLADAGRWLHELAGDDIDRMKERYGHGQLCRLMDAAELFEIVDEPTGGGSRAAYRVRRFG